MSFLCYFLCFTQLSLYLIAISISLTKFKSYPLIALFLLTFFLFISSRPTIALTGLIDNYDLQEGGWFYSGRASEDTVIKTLLLISIFLALSIIVMLIKNPVVIKSMPSKVNGVLFKQRHEKTLQDVSLIILYISAPLYAYRCFLIYKAITLTAVYDLYTGAIQIPFILNFSMAIFQVCFIVFISTRPNKKLFIYNSLFYLAICSLSLSTGQRTEFMCAVLFIYWAGCHFGFFKLSIINLAIYSIPLIAVSIIVNNIRNDISSDFLSIDGFLDFLWGQGVTIYTIYGIIDFNYAFGNNDGLYFINKLISCDIMPALTSNYCVNGEIVAAQIGIWWQKLAYLLDPILFESGAGLGGSVIGSLYIMFNYQSFFLSMVLFSLSSTLFIIFILNLSKLEKWGTLSKIYFFYAVNITFFIPRAGFDSYIPHPRMLIATLFILLLSFFASFLKTSQRSRYLIIK